MLADYFLSHAATLVALFASFVLVVRLLDSKRSAQSTFAWLLGIVFVPFVAIPLFLLLGRRKFPQRAKGPDVSAVPPVDSPEPGEPVVAHVLRQCGVTPARSGNGFELIATGEAAFARLLELIHGAERSIDLTMFILANDATGRAVLEALAERAAQGVSIRVVLDAVGSARSLDLARRLLAAKGAEVRAFMPLRHSPIRGRSNLRSHRKLAIFDGERVFGGGMNLATEYMGTLEAAPAFPRWRDLAAVVNGPAALDAVALFESDWRYCGGAPRASAVVSGLAPDARGDAMVQVVPSGPDMLTDTVYDAFLTAIFEARVRVALVTPYYVPDEALQHALVLAAQRGVHVDIVVPSRSNHRLADVARRSLLRELVAAGVSIHFYPLGMVHAKAMVVDEHTAYVGSPNFDMRSLFLNYEVAFFLYSREAVASVRSFIDGLIEVSAENGPAERERWLFERVARLLAPEL